MKTRRSEPWGSIHYNAELDEFEGELAEMTSRVVLDRPLSAGCLVTGRCKVPIGSVFTTSLDDLRCSSEFNLNEHCLKWLSVISLQGALSVA